MLGNMMVSEVAEVNTHRTDPLGVDPCPTGPKSVNSLYNQGRSILTLHFKGRPLTLYPLNWQIAIAAFS